MEPLPLEAVPPTGGGSGAGDAEVRARFGRICYIPVGQQPDVRDLQRSLHRQLCQQEMDGAAAANGEAAAQALAQAAQGRKVLLIVDDAWVAEHVRAFVGCLDGAAAAGSCVVVTTRIGALVAGAVEVPLALLSRDAAAKMLLTVAGVRATPPYAEAVHKAAQACGRLPLTLAIAGGILMEQFFGEVTAEFAAMLGDDHSEVLRQGQIGDGHVQLGHLRAGCPARSLPWLLVPPSDPTRPFLDPPPPSLHRG